MTNVNFWLGKANMSDMSRAFLEQLVDPLEQWYDDIDHWLCRYVGFAITGPEADTLRLWLRGFPPPADVPADAPADVPADAPAVWTPIALERQPAITWVQSIVPFHPMLTEAPTGDALVALRKISDAVLAAQEADAQAAGWTTIAPCTGLLSFTRL
jgi:hypothetical protein